MVEDNDTDFFQSIWTHLTPIVIFSAMKRTAANQEAQEDEVSVDVKPVSVHDAVALLTAEVGTKLYFLHVPDQRRRAKDRRSSGLGAYAEVSRMLRKRGAMVADLHVSLASSEREGKEGVLSLLINFLCFYLFQQELRLVWSKFQSARATFTTHLRDSLIDAIDWRKAGGGGLGGSRKGTLAKERIDTEISLLRWPTLPPISAEKVMYNPEEEQPISAPTKRRKKCESTESPFRLHAQR